MGSGPNGTWDVVGSSYYRFAPGRIRFLDRQEPFSGRQWSFEYPPPWPLIASTVMNPLLLALACAGSAALGALRQGELGRHYFAWLSLLLSLVELAAGAGFIAARLADTAALPLVRGLSYAVLAAVLWRQEALFFDWLRVTASLNLLCRLLDDCVLSQDC